ncbi:MAG: glycosyl hydrolase 115 family protein [Bacteroidaceae bacterium]|nr:glycosyl hydrolase 115 family protein [Bacteroidaceae bacterium]
MKRFSLFLLALCCFLVSLSSHATEPFIHFEATPGALSLDAATVGFLSEEHSCVQRAAATLCSDFERVTGVRPSQNPQPRILIGTVGVNKQIDQWVRQGILNNLKGKTEKYIIKTIGEQLVIAGSDKRGTVFGIYELSRQLGVSPWYWWADVPVEHHEHVYAQRGEWTDGEPAVRWRGLFLNDEGPCLMQWVKNTYGTKNGDHRFYERVFELILRLKGNFLWPAMWDWAFYADDPLNSKTADEMGIVIGTSHHEPMARNHQEWARHRREYGPWNYQKNQKVIDQFFREGIERMKGTDDLVTIGMRGDGDEAMSEEADTRLLETIVKNQRKIIQQVTGRPAKETPQVWALYKEVLDYYDKGMRVPDDVTILLCDDNWGNVRRVPTTDKERKRPGGWGLYYHVDYVGAPRNSKWLNVTPSQNMWEQLTLAFDYGLDRLWVLNVGDLKPMEYPISLFMDMAWAPRSVSRDVVGTHTRPFCVQQFGEAEADEAARILNRACKLNGRSTAEMLDARTYNLQTGEWREVADDYMRLEAEALRQFIGLRPAYRDAYQQLILFPVQAMSNLHQMYYAQAMNHALAKRNDPDANLWAERVRDCFRRDSLLCAAYNHDISGGKWNGLMIQKHIGYTSWNDDFPADKLPEVRAVQDDSHGGFVFTAQNRMVVMEAEHYYSATATDQTAWTVIPDMGRTRSAVSLMPYTQPVGNASLTYRFRLDDAQLESVRLHIVTKSTLDFLNQGGLTFNVSIDGGEPQIVNFNINLNEKPENIHRVYYPTVARRVVESVVTLPLNSQRDTHDLTITPQAPAIVFEKIVVDAGGYQPSYLFGTESPKSRIAQ